MERKFGVSLYTFLEICQYPDAVNDKNRRRQQKTLVFLPQTCYYNRQLINKEASAVTINALWKDAQRELDWLTALVPILLTALVYYRLPAALLALTAIGGSLMAEYLLHWATKETMPAPSLPRAALTGLLLAFCLPAAAPLWLAALGGGLSALFAALPPFVQTKKPRWALPVLHPVLPSFLLLRAVFPSLFATLTMPAQWAGIDTLSSATPLAALSGQVYPIEGWQLFFGIYPAAIGEGCTAAILLAATYLLLRRRIEPVAPICLLGTVALLSRVLCGSYGYALLAGGVALTALLLADTAYSPARCRDRVLLGVLAGALTVALRRWGFWAEGVTLATVVARLLVPLYPRFFALCGRGWQGLKSLVSKLLRKILKK